jgi:hypothetical protein
LKNGGSVKIQRTDAPHGVISLATMPTASGASVLTELQIEGVRYAFLTFTNEKGDTEQQLVPVPFSKIFYPKTGWIIGMVAQKTRVTRIDPLHPDSLEIMDDGKTGEMRVAIRINGLALGSAQTSEPFGVASTTIKIP